MTPQQLNEIEARHKADADGPWVDGCELTDYARTDIPALIAEVRRLQNALDRTKLHPMTPDDPFPKDEYSLIRFKQKGIVKWSVVIMIHVPGHIYGGGLASVRYNDEEILGWTTLDGLPTGPSYE